MEFEKFLYCLLICFTLSFLIGIERQYRKRIIGLRTTILVSLGAFLFVSFSFSVGASDISRIASQVVAGIGFLGAGVILKDGKKIRGLTTAATLWCDAAIGILCAGGAIKEAILGTAILLFSNTVLLYVNKLINEISSNKHQLYNYEIVIASSDKEITNLKKELTTFFENEKVITKNVSLKKQNKETKLIYNILILDSYYQNNKLKQLELRQLEEIKKEELEEE